MADLLWAVYDLTRFYPAALGAVFLAGAALAAFGLVVIGRSDRD